MKIGNFESKGKIFILAEIGSNHNGDFNLAKMLVEEAANSGADGVKFQTFNPDTIVHKDLPIFPSARGIYKTQHERLSALKLEYEQFKKLKKLANKLGVLFLSTPFDEDSTDFLDEIVPFYKVSSGDIANIPLLKHIAGKRKPVILSTGMANEKEIEKAMDIFPKENIILLHCVALYPTPIEKANLLSIPYLREKYNIPVGYSDHTIGLAACKIAAALGAILIEKHFTLDKNQPIGDHKISMDPADLADLVKEVRNIEKALGVYGKPIESEKEAAKIMRRSLYARTYIPKGATVSSNMIVALRPASGLLPEELENLVGKVAQIDIKKGTLLTKEMFALPPI